MLPRKVGPRWGSCSRIPGWLGSCSRPVRVVLLAAPPPRREESGVCIPHVIASATRCIPHCGGGGVPEEMENILEWCEEDRLLLAWRKQSPRVDLLFHARRSPPRLEKRKHTRESALESLCCARRPDARRLSRAKELVLPPARRRGRNVSRKRLLLRRSGPQLGPS